MSDMADQIFGSVPSAENPSSRVVGSSYSQVSPDGQSGGSVSSSEERSAEQTTAMTSLACRVMDTFRQNADFRRSSGVDEKLAYCLRAHTLNFSDAQNAELLKTFGPEVCKRLFTPITATKNRAAKAMLVDLVNQSGDPLFHIEPTPVPDVPTEVEDAAVDVIMSELNEVFSGLVNNKVESIPPEAMEALTNMVKAATQNRVDEIVNKQEEFARDAANRMEKKVWDLMVHGKFKTAFKDFLDNVCVYGTAVMVGPVDKVVAVNRCVETKKGIKRYRRVYENRVSYESVNPQDCYPSPDAKNVDDGALCIRTKYTSASLSRMARSEGDSAPDGKGWIRGAVRDLVMRHPRGGVKISIDQYSPERRYCERNGSEDTNDCTFEGVRCFDTVGGFELLEMGITEGRDGKRIEQDEFYRTETVVIENRVVYCRIYDDATDIPVSKGTFYALPGSWWGESIADKLGQCQTVLNNTVIALMKNMPLSSGAIFWIKDFQRLVNKSPDAVKLRGGMTVPFSGGMGGDNGAPIGAVSVPSTAGELLAVWKDFVKQADLDSGIPAYSEGQAAGSSGALRTAEGLKTLTEASTRGFKMVMTSIDDDVISRVARLTADYVLIHDDDQTLKGDVEVRSVGLIGRILKAQRDQARLQLFNMVINNQNLAQMFGPTGIIELLRPSVQDVDINPDDVLPSKGKLEQMEQVAKLKELMDATASANGVRQNVGAEGEGESAGAPPGVQQPPSVQSGVESRRAVA